MNPKKSKKTRCFSKCRKIPEDSCKEKTRLCQYIDGKTRKYCKLSKYYTLDKQCNITKKKKKMTKKEAIQRIGTFVHRQHKKQRENYLLNHTQKKKTPSREHAAVKIGKFMKKTENKRRARFLKTICSDSGVCIAFGTEIRKINAFFNDFVDFQYAVSPIKRIGAVSKNGFVREIKFVREGYECYAVLKSTSSEDADNLMYEYEVGQFVNLQNKCYPCFLETYGLFRYKDDQAWKHAKEVETITADVLQNSLLPLDDVDYSVGCPYARDMAIITQHVKDAQTCLHYLEKSLDHTIFSHSQISYTVNHEILYLLFQLYMPLSTLKNEFTHYDLHLENVLLYEPSKTSYITYHYHMATGETVKFKSRYIAKIIDYGRCYYNNGEQDSKKTYQKICKMKQCDPDCGFSFGLNWLSKSSLSSFKKNYILSRVKNVSHDLRFITMMREVLTDKSFQHYLSADFSRLLKQIVFKTHYGTEEVVNSGLPSKINNVRDACTALKELIMKQDVVFKNDVAFASFAKMGEFHIYQDGRPMQFYQE